MSTRRIPDSYNKNPPPNAKKKTAADYGWPDKWKPITRETYELIRQSRAGSHMPALETLVLFGFRETTWWKGPKQRTLFAYPVGAHLKIAFADIRESDKTYPKRFWWTTEGFPQDMLTGFEVLTHDGSDEPDNLLIPEGQWDAMTLSELGYAAAGLLNASQKALSPKLVIALQRLKTRVFLIGDNDGNAASSRVVESIKTQLEEAKVPVGIIQLPGKVKDVCEMVKRYGPKQARAYLDWWIEGLKAGRQIVRFANGTEVVASSTTSSVVVLDDKVAAVAVESICAADITPKRKEWLWRDRIPLKKQTVFGGEPDTGKSSVARCIAAYVTRGLPFPDGENRHPASNVLFLTSEEDKNDTVVPSLIAHGADLHRVHFATQTVVTEGANRKERKIALDTDLAAVEALVRKHGCLFVVIDAFTSYLGNLKRNDDREMRPLLEALNGLAERTGVALLSIGHFNKDGNKAGIHRLSGAGALVEVPRAVWAFVHPPAEEDGETEDGKPIYLPRHHFMLNAKLNVSAEAKKTGLQFDFESVFIPIEGQQEEVGKVKWGGSAGITLASVLNPNKPGPKPQKLTAAKDWLDNLLASGAMPEADVKLAAEKADINEYTLRDAKQLLQVKSYRPSGSRVWWWALPGYLTPKGSSVE